MVRTFPLVTAYDVDRRDTSRVHCKLDLGFNIQYDTWVQMEATQFPKIATADREEKLFGLISRGYAKILLLGGTLASASYVSIESDFDSKDQSSVVEGYFYKEDNENLVTRMQTLRLGVDTAMRSYNEIIHRQIENWEYLKTKGIVKIFDDSASYDDGHTRVHVNLQWS